MRLEICVFVRPGRYTLLLRCASCIDPALALAILKVYDKERAERTWASAVQVAGAFAARFA